MRIKSFQGGFDKNLSYLIWCESTYCAGIVDASVNFTDIYKFINRPFALGTNYYKRIPKRESKEI